MNENVYEKFEMETVDEQMSEDPKLDFYKRALNLLTTNKIPFLVGGAYALHYYTGVFRDTKDLDVFTKPRDYRRSLDIFAAAGFNTELTFTHWLAKATWNSHLVDIIFNSGNALSEVDDRWFEYAEDGELFEIPVKFIPPEEMIWSKGFVMERERYDGADLNHILLARGKTLDWNRLLERYGPHWRVLLSHLVLFGFVYPSERGVVPEWVISELIARLESESKTTFGERICQGTLLSRSQYKIDVEKGKFQDARLIPSGNMTEIQIKLWDEGASGDHRIN